MTEIIVGIIDRNDRNMYIFVNFIELVVQVIKLYVYLLSMLLKCLIFSNHCLAVRALSTFFLFFKDSSIKNHVFHSISSSINLFNIRACVNPSVSTLIQPRTNSTIGFAKVYISINRRNFMVT